MIRELFLPYLFPVKILARHGGLTLTFETLLTIVLALKLYSLVYQTDKFKEDTVEVLIDQAILLNNLKNNHIYHEELSKRTFEESLKKMNDTLKQYSGVYVPSCKHKKGIFVLETVGGNSMSVRDLLDYKISQDLRKSNGESCVFDRQIVKTSHLDELSSNENIQRMLEIVIFLLGLAILYLKIMYYFYCRLFMKESKGKYISTTPAKMRYF